MKKVLSVFLSIVMLFSFTMGTNITSYASTLTYSGKCGKNLTWKLTIKEVDIVEEKVKLVISGTGDMYNYKGFFEEERVAPWFVKLRNYMDDKYGGNYYDFEHMFINDWGVEIDEIIIKKGITRIGACAFEFVNCPCLKLPNTVKSIGKKAFYEACFEKFMLNDGLKTIEKNAFFDLGTGGGIYIPSSVKTMKNCGYGKHTEWDDRHNCHREDGGDIYSFNNSAAISYVKSTKCKDIEHHNVYIPNITLNKPSAVSDGIKVKWKKNTSVSGYQIQYSKDKKFKKNEKIIVANKKQASKTIKELGSKKKYYVRIRAYKSYSGRKVYGKWSVYKSVCTK